jgi:serine/threonine-protein kinase RsbW
MTLIVPSDLAVLPVIRAFVESVCRLGPLDQKATDAIVLATNEAASNVIRHAHRMHPEIQLHIQCVLRDDAIEVHLHDEGAPFNVCDVPHFDPAEIRLGGRGVFLMRALVDEIVCSRRDNGGNTLRMVKRRCTPKPACGQAG